MTDSFLAIGSIYAAIEAGALVLTPNHRTSVQLLEAYGAERRRRGAPAVCRSPDILPVDLWVRRSWDALLDGGHAAAAGVLVLTPLQELQVWKRIVADSAAGTPLLNRDAAARSLQQAYTLMQQWEIGVAELRPYTAPPGSATAALDDVSVFLQWLNAYDDYCGPRGLLSLSRLVREVLEALRDGQMQAPERLLCAGFTTPPPLYRRLLAALGAGAGTADEFSWPRREPQVLKRGAPDARQELRAAALWAREQLERDAGARIAILLPDLQHAREQVEDIFSAVFEPEDRRAGRGGAARWSMSAGPTLDDSPAVAGALRLLELLSREDQVADTLSVCRLLRSPFLAGADAEDAARAALELRLRERGEPRLALADLRRLALREDSDHHCPVLAAGLLEAEALRRRQPARRGCRDWLPVLEQVLALLGWPGPRPPDAAESRQLERWHDALRQFQEFSLLEPALPLSGAVALLDQLCRQLPLRGPSHRAPVQVLGPVEADGLQFTHLWFAGLSETGWPPPPRPNPLLPLAVQQRHGLPGCGARQQAQQARAMLDAFVAASAEQVVLSYPCRDDEAELRPCAMLDAFAAQVTVIEAVSAPGLHEAVPALLREAATEGFEDAPRVALRPDEAVRGGTSLIANQAACPFKGFAVARLDARELTPLSIGLPPRAAGQVLHEALERFWNDLRDSDQLRSAGDERLREAISEAVNGALRAAAARYPQTLSPRYRELEAARLRGLLWEWTRHEGQRGAFAVADSEYRVQWRHAGLTLNLRIDRVDRLPDGGHVLVDYKSGKAVATNWLDQRQDKPQLPLYLLAAEAAGGYGDIGAVLYAQVNIEDMRYRGIAAQDEICPGQGLEGRRDLPEELDWDGLKASWQASLRALAEEFLAGYAVVDPKSPQSCQYCHLHGLCRIREVVE